MEINVSQLKKLRDFLQEKTGIYIEDEKLESTYRHKIKNLLKELKYRDFESFFADIYYRRNKKLLQKLIEIITVNETYFFREEYQFKTLVEDLLPELDSIRPKEEIISILSAPCSTGEELYSIAIYIMENSDLAEKRDLLLLGIDIDTQAIEKAKKGVFSERSVHRLPRRILAKYFEKKENGYEAKKILKDAVNFKAVNVMDRSAMEALGRFDVIFSRNMLIYFSPEDQIRVVETFYLILKPGGFLLLGHAEKVPHTLRSYFSMERRGESFVYRKVS